MKLYIIDGCINKYLSDSYVESYQCETCGDWVSTEYEIDTENKKELVETVIYNEGIDEFEWLMPKLRKYMNSNELEELKKALHDYIDNLMLFEE